MRVLYGAAVFGLLSVLSCGGEQTPPAAAPNSETAVAAAAEGGRPEDPGPSTTTLALADAGNGQGSKLAEATKSASTDEPKPMHAHEPGRGPADIRALVVAHRDEARACYDNALAEHPGMEGDLVVAWTIDPKGVVVEAAVDASRSQITEPSVIDCVSGIIKRIQFASSPGGYESHAFYPFNFHPRHAKGAK